MHKYLNCMAKYYVLRFSTLVFAGYFSMVQIRSDRMDEKIAKLEENFNIKFNDRKEDMKEII